jgi:hypothetical protein
LVPGSSKAASSTPASVDPLGRTTPRSSIHKFLEACVEKKYEVAAQYLDLRKLSGNTRAAEGSELARDLKTLLDRNYRFQLSKLSDSPDGDKNDALAPDIDELATFDLNGEMVKLNLERVNQQPGGLVWLVSSDSVSLIPDLNAYLGESALEKHLPSALVHTKLLGTPLWVWLALVLLAVVLSAVSRWLSKYRTLAIAGFGNGFSRLSRLHRSNCIAARSAVEASDVALHTRGRIADYAARRCRIRHSNFPPRLPRARAHLLDLSAGYQVRQDSDLLFGGSDSAPAVGLQHEHDFGRPWRRWNCDRFSSAKDN